MKDYFRLRWLEKALKEGSAWPGLWQARNIQRGREKTHTKGHYRDQYVATMLFRKWSENIKLEGDRFNDLKFHDVWNRVSRRFGTKGWHEKRELSWVTNELHKPEFSFVTQVLLVCVEIWHHIRLICDLLVLFTRTSSFHTLCESSWTPGDLFCFSPWWSVIVKEQHLATSVAKWPAQQY